MSTSLAIFGTVIRIAVRIPSLTNLTTNYLHYYIYEFFITYMTFLGKSKKKKNLSSLFNAGTTDSFRLEKPN